jgi:hypothetical protein
MPIVDEERAVFITGLGRSGSTLLLKLFDGHPELLTIPVETLFFREILPALEERGREAALARLAELMVPATRIPGRPLDAAAYVEAVRAELGDEAAGEALLRAVVRAYGRATGQVGRAAWVEKTPRNEMYRERITAWFAAAKFVNIVRDPRGVYQSHLKSRKYVPAPVEVIAKAWVGGFERFRALQGGSACALVRYEDLVTDPAGEMRRLAAFVGVGWSEALLAPTEHGVAWRGNSFDPAENVSPEVRRAGVDSWRTALEAADVAAIERICGEAMAALGYA